jgi:hypothetical protein
MSKEDSLMMTSQENEQVPSSSDLLTSQEQAICKQIANREAPHSQRASALLALNGGSTQAQAAEGAGLSAGQVRYWLARFRKQRMDIFPDALLSDLGEATGEEVTLAQGEEPESAAEEVGSSGEKTKEAKTMKKTKKTKKKAVKAEKKEKKAKKSEKKVEKAKKDKKDKKVKRSEKKAEKAKKDKKEKKAKKSGKKSEKDKKDKKAKKNKKKK